jgi:putative tryptophan/tyrosine transport system substrate-binding protein
VSGIRRREFVILLGSAAAAWPLAARAQQQPVPVVGFVHSASPEPFIQVVAAFRRGLGQSGHVEGQNVVIEYHWAENRNDRLPDLISDLVRRRVAVIAAGGPAAAQAAKAATSTIPVVFVVGHDPVRSGLVASLNRPGGNVTGISFLINVLTPKQLEVLRELVPEAKSIGVLLNPDNPFRATDTHDLREAARSLGIDLVEFSARTESGIDAAFGTLASRQPCGLVVVSDTYVFDRRTLIAELAARYRIPTIYPLREFAAAGGLVSYGSSITDAYRLQGALVGQVLKGAKPPDLPVQQSVGVELVINLKTAKALGISVPLPLIGRADEVIE